MTDRAALAEGFMFEHKRTPLRRMTLDTIIAAGQHSCTASLKSCAFVRRVAFGAAQAALGDGMMAGLVELSAHVGMATETGVLCASSVLCKGLCSKN